MTKMQTEAVAKGILEELKKQHTLELIVEIIEKDVGLKKAKSGEFINMTLTSSVSYKIPHLLN
jgi:hypothetical protein